MYFSVFNLVCCVEPFKHTAMFSSGMKFDIKESPNSHKIGQICVYRIVPVIPVSVHECIGNRRMVLWRTCEHVGAFFGGCSLIWRPPFRFRAPLKSATM
ncbi:unnamed protein product [Periconia digitata]|uniref:Uncharacterized protein n=1 Tax=Periconia digitata TaxID=1303443 RepID=A0A9W4XNE0_9PLEO|nr:unnamed protein product [Periconia digitata]